MTKNPAPAPEHPSSSRLQREAELAMLKRLGKERSVGLAKRRVDYHRAVVEIDGVDENQTVFVEAYARIGRLKTGQGKKVATDALKLVALTEQYPDAQMMLAFADQAAADSVVAGCARCSSSGESSASSSPSRSG